jgi:hypothetical protein
MSKAPDRPVLIKSINFWWYPLTLIPLLALLYFSFTGALPLIAAMISVFLLFFWLFSLGFALYAKLRKPPKLRQ